MVIIDLILGFLLLFSGKNFFWLCVGTVGFLIGVQCSTLIGFSSGWTALLAALAFGLVGIILAICFEWIAVIFGVGFLGGGYLLMQVFPSLAWQDSYSWLIFVIGGVVGMCLMVIVFDFTLIAISSILGATLIVKAFHGTQEFQSFLFIASVIAGISVQYLTLKDYRKQERVMSN